MASLRPCKAHRRDEAKAKPNLFKTCLVGTVCSNLEVRGSTSFSRSEQKPPGSITFILKLKVLFHWRKGGAVTFNFNMGYSKIWRYFRCFFAGSANAMGGESYSTYYFINSFFDSSRKICLCGFCHVWWLFRKVPENSLIVAKLPVNSNKNARSARWYINGSPFG